MDHDKNERNLPIKENLEKELITIDFIIPILDGKEKEQLLQIKSGYQKILRCFDAVPLCNRTLDKRGLHLLGDEPIDVIFEIENKIKMHLEDEAEDICISYYKNHFSDRYIRLKRLPNYELRKDIIEKAHSHFLQEDYISCIPLILMMADGAANDVLPKGIFAEGIDITIWNHIGTLYGIEEYIKSFMPSRKTTRGDAITIPYRHGILHGRDTGYGTEKVALKAWALLFNLCDLFIAKTNEPLEKRKYIAQQKRIQEEDKRFRENPIGDTQRIIHKIDQSSAGTPIKTAEEWHRELASQDVSLYQENSAGWTFHTFMQRWRKHNYSGMLEMIDLGDTFSASRKYRFMENIKRFSFDTYEINFIHEHKENLVFGTMIKLEETGEKKELCITLSAIDDRNDTTCCIDAHHWIIFENFLDIIIYKE